MTNWSRLIHDKFFKDKSQSLCSRAWEKKDRHLFWKVWTKVFGEKHCNKSYEYYHSEHNQ